MSAVWQNSKWWNIFQSPTIFKIQSWIQPPTDIAIAKLKLPTRDFLSLDIHSNAKKTKLHLNPDREFLITNWLQTDYKLITN